MANKTEETLTQKTDSLSVDVDSSIDPFDPSSLKLSQDYSALAGVKKVLNSVPVRRPSRQDYIRTNPDPEYWLDTAVLELKEERETYLVHPSLRDALPGELINKSLILTVNRPGVLTIWPIRLPGEDGRVDAWNASAADAAQMALEKWVRLSSNMSLGEYDIYEATGKLPDPEWPNLSMKEILKIAFKNHFIDSLDHPVIQRLQGSI